MDLSENKSATNENNIFNEKAAILTAILDFSKVWICEVKPRK